MYKYKDLTQKEREKLVLEIKDVYADEVLICQGKELLVFTYIIEKMIAGDYCVVCWESYYRCTCTHN